MRCEPMDVRLLVLAASAVVATTGCADLDGFVWDPVHCTTVGPTTCENEAEIWDKVCVPCADSYAWQRTYPWREKTLAGGHTIRPVPQELVKRVVIKPGDDGVELDGYFLTSHGDDKTLAKTTIIYNHGNFAGIEHYLPRVRMLYEAGFNLFVWDYRGYGKSLPADVGTPAELVGDARVVFDRVKALAPDGKRIVSYGFSLGGVPAVEMAAHGKPCALLLEGAFTSIEAIVGSNAALSLPESFLSSGHLDNIRKIAGYAGPVFGMYGTDDEKFPEADGAKLIDAAPGTGVFWAPEGARHGIAAMGVPEIGYATYVAKMRSFLDANAGDCIGP